MNNRLPKWRAIQTYTSLDDYRSHTRVVVYDDYESAKNDCQYWLDLMRADGNHESWDMNLSYRLCSNAGINAQLEALNDPVVDNIEIGGQVGNNGGVFLGNMPIVATSEFKEWSHNEKKYYLSTRERKISQRKVDEYGIPSIAIDYLTGKVYHNLYKTR